MKRSLAMFWIIAAPVVVDAADPADAAPVVGTFRGDEVNARLETELTMRVVPTSPPKSDGD